MTGRRRRASTSSVDTEDERKVSWCKEKSVLRFNHSGVDPETCFELKNAIVLNKDGQTLENALDVATRGPYIIRGTLLVEDPAQKAHLIMKVRRSIELEVTKCELYSIGEDENGSPIIWVAGTCAWFELNPSKAYAPIYRQMREAVVLYYRLLAIYSERQPKKAKKGKKDIERDLYQVFHEYATRIGDGSTLEEVISRCDQHASFLISQCTQDSSELDWRNTPFYQWLTKRHKDTYDKEIERLNKPRQPLRSPSMEIIEPSAPSVPQALPSRTRNGSSATSVALSNATPEIIEIEASPPPQRASRSRSTSRRADHEIIDLVSSTQISRDTSAIPRPTSVHSSTSTPSFTPHMSDMSSSVTGANETPFQSVLNAIEQVYADTAHSKAGLTLSAAMNKLWTKYRFPYHKSDQKAAYRVPIEEVLHYNAGALLEALDIDKYKEHGFYTWLVETSGKPFHPVAIRPSDFPFRLVRRKQSSNANSNKLAQPPPLAQIGTPKGPANEEFSSPARSSPAGKSIRRPGRPSGVKSSLRLAAASRKRAHSDVDSDSHDEGAEPKRSHYFSDEDDAIENEGQRGLSEDERAPSSSEELVKIFLRADNIPTTVPRGPDETWVCEENDCGYIVRGGDVQDCGERIRQHFNEHEQQMNRVSLAMTEGSRGHLPVKYVLFKPFLILVELNQSHAFPAPKPRTPSPETVDEVNTAASTPTLTNSPVRVHLYQSQTPISSPKAPIPITTPNFRSMVDEFRRRPHPVSDNIDRLTLRK
ncbi:hypothetical protein FPSE_04132 [Fusarium pseudograminearum CS3096]|uniref:DNA (cytosine-5)-methyltransferase 1 replication foci domain-containing protein n=1 Tax=Fusarium pseudograminearum (strain CS3096) TaxID=1028729 RepID=K3UT05_FUSPC|nr:hypothetical protein FPSE_04132 [Fusarium pseudograminearum CS3096]EKJ75631.1 hypothetical protein FPSE_04132 [Fusarium pseudograminearum CS3096]